MEQIAYIDLSKGEASTREIPEELLRLYLGGIGLNAYLLYNHAPTGVDALDPANPLIFGAGLFNGYPDSSASRFQVSGKSPETGIYGTGNSGGFWGPELKHAGFQHLVITGKASRPTYLWIHDGKIEFRDASFIWGKDNYEAQRLIGDDLGEPEAQIACIGQAGENLVRFACVMQGLKRAAGRTGMGCLMGSKNLKAIAVKGSMGLEAHDPSALLAAAHGHFQRIITSKIFPILSRYGTLTIFAMQNEGGQIAAYNNQLNHFEEAEGKLEDEVFEEQYKTKTMACASCPIHCSHRFQIDSGPYAGVWGEGPEYYYMSGFGPVVGNTDWEVILTAGDLINRYGLDVGSTSAYIGWLMELWQRGIIDRELAGPLNLEWGNAEAILGLVHQMGKKEGLGGLVAEHGVGAADVIGRGAGKYLNQGKRLIHESGINDRAAFGTCLGEATTNRGFCHLRGRSSFELMGLPEEVLTKVYGRPVDPDFSSWRGKPWMAIWTQHFTTIADCLGMCKFATMWPGSTTNIGYEDFCDTIKAIKGWDVTPEELMEVGERVWNLERMFNVRESQIRREVDMPPDVFYQPNKSEPLKGRKIIKEEYNVALDEYYGLRGWNTDGTPQKETLTRLGLGAEPSRQL